MRERGWVTTGTAARRLGYTSRTVRRWCDANKVPGAVRLGAAGDWKIPATWVQAQLASPEAQAAAPDVELSVYVIRCAVTGLRKIGVSSDVPSRLAGLRSQSPTGPSMELEIAMPGSLALERALHARFAEQRTHGEWFRLDDDAIATVCALAAQGDA